MLGSIGTMELILLLFAFIPLIISIIALVDILKSDFRGINKIIWVMVVFFFPIIGPVLYLIIGRKQKEDINLTGTK